VLQEFEAHIGETPHIEFFALHLLSEELAHFSQVEDGLGKGGRLAQTLAPDEEFFLV
jgi:hypothetical protein